jgi:hypothetical protein
MSEPDTYGAGTIGIVSYKSERPVPSEEVKFPARRIRNRQPVTAINREGEVDSARTRYLWESGVCSL